jgi:hypothetical protein
MTTNGTFRRNLCVRLAGTFLACGLVVSTNPALAAPAIVGTWGSMKGHERITFEANGRFRTCLIGNKKGNASMGLWRRQAGGRFEVEFTHTATTDCARPAQALRQHAASIVGQVLISRGELSLYVSGEFPPDIYRPVVPEKAKR